MVENGAPIDREGAYHPLAGRELSVTRRQEQDPLRLDVGQGWRDGLLRTLVTNIASRSGLVKRTAGGTAEVIDVVSTFEGQARGPCDQPMAAIALHQAPRCRRLRSPRGENIIVGKGFHARAQAFEVD